MKPILLSIMRWLAFFASSSLRLVYFQGGTLLVRDTRRALQTGGGAGVSGVVERPGVRPDAGGIRMADGV